MASEIPPTLRAPDAPRPFRLHPYQWVGIPLMFLVPVLALFGVFGESWEREGATSEALDVGIHYADRYRYKQINTVEVRVRNRTASLLDTVVVAFDEDYVREFSTLMFVPSVTEAFEVELYDVAPGERRLVWAEFQAERYGRHEGALRVYVPGQPDTASVVLSTFVFP